MKKYLIVRVKVNKTTAASDRHKWLAVYRAVTQLGTVRSKQSTEINDRRRNRIAASYLDVS